MRSLEELELLIRSSGEEGTLEPKALTPPHPVDPLRREGRGRRARAAAVRGEPSRSTTRWPTLAEQAVADRPLALPGGRRRPRRRARRRPREGRVPRPLRRTRPTTPVTDLMLPPFVVPETRRPGRPPRRPAPRRHATSRSSSTSTVARPASSPSRTCSRRSSARSTTSTTRPPRASPACSARGSGCSTARCTPTRCSTPAASRSPMATTRRWPASCSTASAASPTSGEGFDHDGWQVEVVERDGLRVATVRAAPSRPSTAVARGRARVIAGTCCSALALLLVPTAFFVAVEFALIASRRTKLEAMAEQGSARARLALGSMRHLNVQLAGAQLGITMASLLLGYVAEPTVAGLIEDGIELVVRRARRACCTPIGFVVALTIVAFLHMVIGEMVPKNVAIADPGAHPARAGPAEPRSTSPLFGPLLRVLNAPVQRGRARSSASSRATSWPRRPRPSELAAMLGDVARRGAHRGGRPPAPHRRARPAGPRASPR